jgi:outer membrane protein OmpA-like peptidoglycan-associated protein
MLKGSLRQTLLLATFIGLFCCATSALAAARPPREPNITVHLSDTGKTVGLPFGAILVVALPNKTYDDNYWYVYRNSGVPLKLIAGPNERRGRNFKPWTRNDGALFYFRRENPGTAHLVLEQSYASTPMILKVVDAPPIPPRPVKPPPVPPTVMKQKVVLRGIHFDFNRSNIRPGDSAVLDEDVSSLKANPGVTINVNGYCDAIGGDDYNMKLSQRRAGAVVDYLVRAGVPSNQLSAHGYGKTDFVATNDTAEGRAQNRRVELAPNE